ncbi:MAG: putative toxin-antitoxin system toxin component, PIN family [Rhodothermales bacterium]
MKTPQIILDTNILYAALYSNRGASYKLLSMIDSGFFGFHLSVPLVLEYEDVLLSSAHELGLSQMDIQSFINHLCRKATLHEVYYLWRPILKDPKDEMVLEVAVKAQCDYIVTYNKADFRGVDRFGIKVVDAAEFVKLLKR